MTEGVKLLLILLALMSGLLCGIGLGLLMASRRSSRKWTGRE